MQHHMGYQVLRADVCVQEIEARIGDADDRRPAPEANWATAVRGRFYTPRKEAISLRLDMGVLDWLRRTGPGYQTEINRILRDGMEAEMRA
jgi:uncharacterized protein (DUF4415 family)